MNHSYALIRIQPVLPHYLLKIYVADQLKTEKK